jgi:two-component sensor histidine kinase
VRNNLAVISGLLNLQTGAIRNAQQAMAAFKNSRDRIMAMALVHQELYQTPDYSRVDMRAYLESLTRHLLQAYGSGEAIRMTTQV